MPADPREQKQHAVVVTEATLGKWTKEEIRAIANIQSQLKAVAAEQRESKSNYNSGELSDVSQSTPPASPKHIQAHSLDDPDFVIDSENEAFPCPDSDQDLPPEMWQQSEGEGSSSD